MMQENITVSLVLLYSDNWLISTYFLYEGHYLAAVQSYCIYYTIIEYPELEGAMRSMEFIAWNFLCSVNNV